MSDAQVYPLDWPANRPRTPQISRRYGQFRSSEAPITIGVAYQRALYEVKRLGGQYPVLSCNLPPRGDGRGPRSDMSPVEGEVGVCLYFVLKGQPIALACDTYTQVAQNIAALAAHLEATRAIARHGVATAEETLQAFAALPPPDPAKRKKPWWEVFGLMRQAATLDSVEALYRAKARRAHPDNGGSLAAFHELTQAREEAVRELSP